MAEASLFKIKSSNSDDYRRPEFGRNGGDKVIGPNELFTDKVHR